MFRALFFLLKLCLLAAAFIWFAQRPGTVTVVWQGYEIQTSIGLVMALVLFGAIVIILFDRLWRALIAVPASLRRWRGAQAREVGYEEITKGLVAIAAGDANQAQKHVRKAKTLLPDAPLTGLLTAAAALGKDDQVNAKLAFENLLDDKRVSFFGLRGLLTQALKSGDSAGALALARRAERMHPKQGWILKTLFDLEVRARRWNEARALLPRLRRFSGLEGKKSLQTEQTLLLALCEGEALGGNVAGALKLARRAFYLDAAFIPATLRTAELFHRLNRRRAAIKTIEAGWSMAQHPDLAELWAKLSPIPSNKTFGERQRAGYEWMRELYELAPHALEAKRAMGNAAMAAGMWEEARAFLQDAGDYRALAELEKSETGSETRVREWLEMAADAPPSKRWVCSSCGRSEFSWRPVCSICGSFDAFSWETPGLITGASPAAGELLPPPVF